MKRLLSAAAILLLAACASSPNGDTSSAKANNPEADKNETRHYRVDAGPNAVGAIPLATLRDAARNKELEMSIEYPTKAGPHPLIIFSHGFGGSSRGYVGLSSYWASYGYVVIKPTHADSGTAQTLREAAEVWETQTAADHRNRVQDVRFIIDSIDALEAKYPELKGKIDRERIGVGGHSYGALTAVMIAGAKTFEQSGASSRQTDARVDAIVAMSPQGPEANIGLTEQSWDEIQIPALFMTGTGDRGPGGREPSWRREPFERAAAGDKWFISIPGAQHFSFAGRQLDQRALDVTRKRGRNEPETLPTPVDPNDPNPGIPSNDPRRNPDPMIRQRQRSPRDAMAMYEQQKAVFENIKISSLAFWETYLRKEDEGRKYLESLRTRNGWDVATR
ncbi:MAG TPA: alpha/beta fold hydrolase [Thermoanaerobaculia bacterium]